MGQLILDSREGIINLENIEGLIGVVCKIIFAAWALLLLFLSNDFPVLSMLALGYVGHLFNLW